MAKRRKVVHVESGKIFSTAAEAERAFGLPNSVLSEAIRLGKPCHGEVFRFATEEDIANEKPNVTITLTDKDRPVKTVINPGCYTDKEKASEYFNSIGYTTEVVDGVVMFYDCEDTDSLADVVKQSGYIASWGYGPRQKATSDSRYRRPSY